MENKIYKHFLGFMEPEFRLTNINFYSVEDLKAKALSKT